MEQFRSNGILEPADTSSLEPFEHILPQIHIHWTHGSSLQSVVVDLLHRGKSANPINATEAEITEIEIELEIDRDMGRDRDRGRKRKDKREKQNERKSFKLRFRKVRQFAQGCDMVEPEFNPRCVYYLNIVQTIYHLSTRCPMNFLFPSPLNFELTNCPNLNNSGLPKVYAESGMKATCFTKRIRR